MQVVLGDVSKWIPMSSDRVVGLRIENTGIDIILAGHVEETVTMAYLLDGEIKYQQCELKTPTCRLFDLYIPEDES